MMRCFVGPDRQPGDLQDLGGQGLLLGHLPQHGPGAPAYRRHRYAYQLLWKEGGGGDYAALSADGVNPIPADYLAVYANPDAVSLVFTPTSLRITTAW